MPRLQPEERLTLAQAAALVPCSPDPAAASPTTAITRMLDADVYGKCARLQSVGYSPERALLIALDNHHLSPAGGDPLLPASPSPQGATAGASLSPTYAPGELLDGQPVGARSRLRLVPLDCSICGALCSYGVICTGCARFECDCGSDELPVLRLCNRIRECPACNESHVDGCATCPALAREAGVGASHQTGGL